MARDRFCLNRQVIEEFSFITLPVTAQMLYVRLCADADDDGIVQAYNTMRIAGANYGDLEILVNRRYVYILDSQGYITYIEHWLAHNRLRADRKVDSRYLALLMEKRPDVKVLIGQPRADTGKRAGRPVDVQWSPQVQDKTSTRQVQGNSQVAVDDDLKNLFQKQGEAN